MVCVIVPCSSNPCLINFSLYFIIQSLINVSEYNLLTEVDKLIPFVPEFIWVYHSLFPAFILSFVGLFKSKRLFFSAIAACIIASLALSLFYIFLPSFYPRPDLGTIDSLSLWLVEFTHNVDAANNTFPSGHVTFSVLLALYLSKSYCTKKHPWLKWVYCIWALTISASTLFLKQHYIVDVFSGFVMAAFCYQLSQKLVFSKMRE